jgi:hypothetical protein
MIKVLLLASCSTTTAPTTPIDFGGGGGGGGGGGWFTPPRPCGALPQEGSYCTNGDHCVSGCFEAYCVGALAGCGANDYGLFCRGSWRIDPYPCDAGDARVDAPDDGASDGALDASADVANDASDGSLD